jgi:hypothetical protein bfra3_13962
MKPFDLLLSTAYAPPISYFAKLYEYQGKEIGLEAQEHYLKQSYRNRCRILSPNGVQALTIPVEQSLSLKTKIRDVRISEHGSWRHLHAQALRTAYGASPFFEYYADELLPFYERRYSFLWDFNEELLRVLIRQLQLEVNWSATEEFADPADECPETCDLRYIIHPKKRHSIAGLMRPPYYQLYQDRFGFVEELSILDLLFEMGPESLLILRDSLTPSRG